MDAVDISILRELRLEPFQGEPRGPAPWRPATLAKRVGASERLVKDRLRRLESTVVGGYHAWPNPRLLGANVRTLAFRLGTPNLQNDVLAIARSQEGFLGFAEFLPNWLNVTFAYSEPKEMERIEGRLRAATRDERPIATFEAAPWPSTRSPSKLDWRILAAILGNARQSYRQIAKDLGVTPRTVERRIEGLARDRLFDVFVRVRPSAYDDLLFVAMVFRFEAGQTDHAMARLHGEFFKDAWARCASGSVDWTHHVDLVCAPGTPRQLRNLLRRAEQIPGVVSVETFLGSAIQMDTRWLERQIGLRVAGEPQR